VLDVVILVDLLQESAAIRYSIIKVRLREQSMFETAEVNAVSLLQPERGRTFIC
jgi:hypothetical protein